ncbi:hypothetical protein ABZ847_27070 [Streptomyces bauhiniae]
MQAAVLVPVRQQQRERVAVLPEQLDGEQVLGVAAVAVGIERHLGAGGGGED